MTDPGRETTWLERRVERMTGSLEHRGPDSFGHWVDAGAGIALGHRRLAIVDLSATGRQPMESSCGRMVMDYNGEIYNAAELKATLGERARGLRGTSDTEVLLEACAEWGVERATSEAIGMFAFALWDRETRCLYLVRDRLGIKPLYYARIGEELLFGSEIKAILSVLAQKPGIDTGALRSFMRHGYIPTPYCIFDGLHKLEPGMILEVPAEGEMRRRRYWQLERVIEQARSDPQSSSEMEWIEALESLLGDAVKRRMVADVSLGAFLSGGIDSSTIVALMQKHSERPVRTFSIGFDEVTHDEAKHARKVAQYLGTDHTELYVEPSAAFDVIPKLAEIYDEPFADSSQIPTLLVSELTRQHVIVSLSGDGGDELFAGYDRYFVRDRWLPGLSKVPRCLRGVAAAAIRGVEPATWDWLAKLLPSGVRPERVGDRAHKLAGLMNARPDEIYRGLVSLWEAPDEIVNGGEEPAQSALWQTTRPSCLLDDVEWMQYIDTLTYLPDDILTKVDRASMAVSLEARVPFLDHRVVELAWRLPRHLKVQGGVNKWILREVLHRHLPRELFERPKMGFGVPIDAWLRGPLREWAQTLLAPSALAATGLLKPALITQRWHEHLSGTRNWHYPIWNVLMFQTWHQRWLGSP